MALGDGLSFETIPNGGTNTDLLSKDLHHRGMSYHFDQHGFLVDDSALP